MASIFDFSSTAGSNTSCDGVNISDGMSAKNVDNAIRSLMAIIRQTFSGTLQSFLSGASALGVSSGGTGATTAAEARTNLGLGSAATESIVPVAKGGTGGATAAAALDGIGALGVVASSLGSPGYIKFNLPGTSTTFMIAWGTVTAQGDSAGSVTYPTAFSTFSIPVISGTPRVTTAAEQGATVTGASTTGFTFFSAEGSVANTGTAYWIAIGV